MNNVLRGVIAAVEDEGRRLAEEFRPVLVKGRGNYLSRRRLRVAQQRMGTLFTDPLAAQQLIQIGRWARMTTGGTSRPA